ncbi:MAG: ABC transporter permease [Gemmataceae bacterium]
MKKVLGIVLFFLALYVCLLFADEGARSWQNHVNLGRRIGLFGIISLGAGLLIISGGIDLSIGSVVALSATIMAMLLIDAHWHPALAIAAVLLVGAVIGLINGLLVTKLRVQAFIVTLCGLFIYRGAARWLASDRVKGLGSDFPTLKSILYSSEVFFGIPVSLVILLVLALVAGVLLHYSVYGRYLYAIGNNERAARFSGIATDRYKVGAYVLCSTLAAFFGILFLMQENQVRPSGTGSFFELYAIAGAVLGGCSLRGGEGTIIGILIGTAIMRLLPNLSNMWGVSSELEFTVIGSALLLVAIMDEWLRRRGARG